MEHALVQTKQLTKKFRKFPAVKEVNLTLNEGDIYGLIGKNGAGKTTLMRMVLGTCHKTAGEIIYNNELLEQGRRIGSIIESPPFFPECSAQENLKRFSMLFGGKQDIDQILHDVDLWDARKKHAGKFSLGMKQRLGIGIALLGHPRFLVLDEPTNGLDPAGITEVRELILKLNREQGISFFISSHILDELGRVATKFGIMNSGELVDEISSAALQEQCKKRLEIYPDDLRRASSLLSERVGADALRVQEDHIVLTRGIEDSAELNKLLWENQIAVSRLELKAETLEQYFMRKVNG